MTPAPEPKKKKTFEKPKVPGYLVSFGDMMTILLTFFILLCTYATTKTSGFVATGVGSFRLAIEALGLPAFMTSQREAIMLGEMRIRAHAIDREEKGKEDRDRRIIEEIEAIKRGKTDILKRDSEVRITLSIGFVRGSEKLEPGYDQVLQHISGLVQTSGRHVEILGHADREQLPAPDRERLALRRAVRIVTILIEEYGAPAHKLAAGTVVGPRTRGPGDAPSGDITLRVFRPGEFKRFTPGGD
jgi:chemotaxis protein MotB